ncbi:hypothetical protein BC832DRAFT_388664 [Gaertneriomyces semiglobifer]|nr:hypothetical protein BC832DRAFT_388664 [Gaertneriomyces semiglobifer]
MYVNAILFMLHAAPLPPVVAIPRRWNRLWTPSRPDVSPLKRISFQTSASANFLSAGSDVDW